jgi:predicted porin
MKKALLPLMIASLVPASAMADINVYGKVWVSLQSVDYLREFLAVCWVLL